MLLAKNLDALQRREIHKLMIEMPPRHAKSTTVDEFFLPYYLLEHPDDRVILASHTADFARTWGRKARRVVEEWGPVLYGLNVRHDTSAANDWEIEGYRGGMLTAGIGGAITGRGANILVIDDPVKDAQEAASETIQERNIDWYRTTANTRLEPGGVQVLIMTRWHEADLAGRLLDEEAHEWTVLRLPAIAEEHDQLGRQVGEALWPERYDVKALADIQYGKVDPLTGQRHGGIGSYAWSALYQQHPTPPEGGMFKRSAWQYYDEAPQGYHPGAIFVDTAGWDMKPTGDWAAFASVIRVQKDLFWLNGKHGHWTFPQLLEELRNEHARTGLPIVVEKVPWAMPLIQVLQRELSGIVPFEIKGVKKEVRAEAASPYQEAGNFYLPRRGQWVSEFVDEHAAFPNGAHDDWVDTTSMAALRLLQPQMPTSATLTLNGKALPPRAPRPLFRTGRR